MMFNKKLNKLNLPITKTNRADASAKNDTTLLFL